MKFFDMKKTLIFFILIIFLLFSGCVGGEDESTPETDSESGTTHDFIIKSSDLPGLTLNGYFFYATPESDIYTFNSSPGSKYTDALPSGTRNVGEKSYWMDESGKHAVAVEIEKYDSDEGLESIFKNGYEWMEIIRKVDPQDANLPWAEYESDTCNFGTNGYYETKSSLDENDVSRTNILFMTSNNELVTINVRDETGKDLDEAMRIAKIVEERL
jgi:hypothetical protein